MCVVVITEVTCSHINIMLCTAVLMVMVIISKGRPLTRGYCARYIVNKGYKKKKNEKLENNIWNESSY